MHGDNNFICTWKDYTTEYQNHDVNKLFIYNRGQKSEYNLLYQIVF